MGIAFRLVLALCLVSEVAFAKVTLRATPLNAVSATSDYTSAAMGTADAMAGSVHCTWASLGGTPDGVFQLQVSNNSGVSWVDKSGAAITVDGASGSDSISLNGSVTEAAYRVKWEKNSVTTSGTLTCKAVFKA